MYRTLRGGLPRREHQVQQDENRQPPSIPPTETDFAVDPGGNVQRLAAQLPAVYARVGGFAADADA